MKNYYQTDELQKLIDWENIMKMPRYAGGHDDQMMGLFKKSIVIGHWNEGGYEGMVATCVQLDNGKYAIYNDYYGSCAGCDSWEGASDEEVRNMCVNLSNGAYIFEGIYDVVSFLKEKNKDGYSWTEKASDALLGEILNNIREVRDIKISDLL